MTSAADAVLLVGTGALAGIVGTAGGITSLISYPALLSVGIPPLPANMTNMVAVVACWPGSALASQPELIGKRSWLGVWALVTAAGGAVGSGLLLLTSSGVFDKVVPFLLCFAASALLLQPRLTAWMERHAISAKHLLLPCGLFSVSMYCGYFGAGAGVLVLTILLLTIDKQIARANALKNMLIGAASIVSAVIFAILGPVDWTAAAPLAAGMFAGSTIGPSIARRIPSNVFRWLVALTGFAMAIRLWISPS